MTKHEQKALELFMNGYNCAQAVFTAFHEECGLDMNKAAKISSSFGGGMGRLRRTCGAVTGAIMALGTLMGYDEPGDDAIKAMHYARVQLLVKRFEEECQSSICRVLLELAEGQNSDPVPTPRTDDFYAKRPCARFVGTAARILDEILEEEGYR